MLGPYASSFVVLVLPLLASVIAFPGRRAVPIRHWRLVLPPLLVAAAALLLLRLPPFDDLRDPEVWTIGIPFILLGIVRGTWMGLLVDHGQGKLLLARASEEFWIAVVALILVLFAIVDEPFGTLESDYVQAIELALVVLACFMVGRNAALLVRSRDTPHHDL